ncbi:MAG TPA: MBL fold metallo-hydrolase [Acidimicrobiales bacterium]|nr:MBL fold metallo-hydrolase [Acidimicrobiales bacterium]
MSSSHYDHPDLPSPWVSEVADGVFAYVQPDGSWWINNTGFIRGERTVLSIDTCSTERRTCAYLAKVEEIAGQVPRALVNTHHHGDHTNGNCFLPFATVIGHERCREEMLRSGIVRPDGLFEPVEWGDLTPAPPFVTFDRRLDIYVDDLKIELIHLTAAAHTTNDVVAWIPEHRVLFSGDLVFNGGTPFVVMGSVAGSLEALSMIMELEPEVVVPGHGSPGGIETVAACDAYLRWLQQSAEQAVVAGLTPLEAARELDLGDFAALLDPERLAGNLHRAFAECRGVGPGEPIDLAAAFADMVALNRGQPLHCMA